MYWSVDISETSQPSLIEGGWGASEFLPQRAAAVASAGSRLFVVSDRNVWKRWGQDLGTVLGLDPQQPRVFLLEPGEESKTVAGVAALWDWLAAQGCRRDDVLVAAGGGVVGDLAGFAAATYLRGVRLWQVPTSLLAQLDSSVGGKVAVNLPAGKNLVGSFYQPEYVVADQKFLPSLPPRELASGLGEAVKCALLEGESFVAYLEDHADGVTALDPTVLSAVVERCVRLKAGVVTEDERDEGRRAVLNLGHTVAHALEHAVGYGTLTHGAAVGLGLLVALKVSESHCGSSPDLLPRVRELLDRFALPTRIGDVSPDAIVEAVARDKKSSAAGLGFVCLRKPGLPVWGVKVEEATLLGDLEVILR